MPLPRPRGAVARIDHIDQVATGLTTPGGLEFLPGGSALVTERDTAEVKLVTPTGRVSVVGKVDGVEPGGEGGLLGIAVVPDGDQVVVYYTAANDHRMASLTWADGRLSGHPDILPGIRNASTHNRRRVSS